MAYYPNIITVEFYTRPNASVHLSVSKYVFFPSLCMSVCLSVILLHLLVPSVYLSVFFLYCLSVNQLFVSYLDRASVSLSCCPSFIRSLHVFIIFSLSFFIFTYQWNRDAVMTYRQTKGGKLVFRKAFLLNNANCIGNKLNS